MAHVIGFVVLLTLATRYGWPNAASGVCALLAGGAAAAICSCPATSGRGVLMQTGAIYAVFALYPLVLGFARDARRAIRTSPRSSPACGAS